MRSSQLAGCSVDLAAYFERIRFTGDVKPGPWDQLQALHRAHQYSVPFENLDVQLGRSGRAGSQGRLREDREGPARRLVLLSNERPFEWALREIGFDVMRMCAA